MHLERILILTTAVLLGGTRLHAQPTDASPVARRPNIVLILTDDQRFDSLGANGNPHIRTPHLDRLAARSVRFTQAHVVMSLCSPSRAAILTGRYGSANGVTSLDAPLRAGEVTFAQTLRAAGYRTALSGKWHIGGRPEDHGFDFACYFRANGTYVNRPVTDNGRSVQPAAHVDDYCVDRSIAFLEDAVRRTEPFLLFHATQLPHMDHRHAWPSPDDVRNRYDPEKLPLPATAAGDLTGKPPQLATIRNRTQADLYGYADPKKLRAHIRDYYAVVTQLDGMVGRLLEALDRLRLRENTWIVFLSDNGWMLGEHRFTSKVLAYDASVRIPLLIAGPGVAPRTESRLALNLDLAPTLLDLAGLPVSPAMHGASLRPLLPGAPVSWRQAFVYECLDGYGGTPPILAAISADWSLVQTWSERTDVGRRRPFEELYDRRNDAAEMRNLVGSPRTATVAGELRRMIAAHLAGLAPAPH